MYLPKLCGPAALLSLACILFVSCGKNVPCIEASFSLGFVAFPGAQTDSMVLRRYVIDGGFSTLIDTFSINKSSSSYSNNGDTLIIGIYSGDQSLLTSKNDYEVVLPKSNKVIKISGIREQQTSHHVGLSMDKTVCINPIKSYSIDGTLVTGDYDYITFYIKP
jgi:hypothetical protein